MFGGALLSIIIILGGEGDTSEKLPLISLFCFAGLKLIPSAQHTYYFANLARSMRASFLTVIDLINALEEPAPKSSAHEKLIGKTEKCLRFISVNFDFGKKEGFSVNNISFECNMGETIAIVGQSGSGKTTILDLALGLLKPKSGRIEFLGKELSSLNPSERAALLGYVPQEVAIIEGDITTNITFRSDNLVSQERAIMEVLREAELLEFVSELPDGMSTKLAKSSDLSGGQKQRVGLARALLKKPKLLILDECTSSLDTVTESRIMGRLFENNNERCTLIVAHRLNTIKKADKIFFMKNGQIVDSGTFNELKQTCPNFQELLRATFEERDE